MIYASWCCRGDFMAYDVVTGVSNFDCVRGLWWKEGVVGERGMVTWQNRHIIGRAQPVPRKAVPNVAPLNFYLAFFYLCSTLSMYVIAASYQSTCLQWH